MSDIPWLLALLEQLFGNEVVKWIALILLPFAVLFALMWLAKGIIEITRTTFIPLFYNAEQKRKIRLRQRFADHIESETRRLNQREDWSDFRFAELEAEVEMEGSRRAFSLFPFIKRSSGGLRREKTLSKALRRSQEKIILLEGEPGSGKSVALRHVALDIARRAIKSKNPRSLIPFYVNLKELRREKNQPVDRSTIEGFIIKTVKRINDRDVDKFLDDEFQTGLENGSWLFLFDSFDEIPEILGAEDADTKIKEYAEAISDFLQGLNACRGVVASRHFKGPSQFGWARFRILNLSSNRQKELIRRSELKSYSEKLLLGNLETAKPEIQKFATNPLFLGLLIAYIQSNNSFPQHSDVVFDAFINRRLTQDKERIFHRFGLNIVEIRRFAEEVAFCMAASPNLGLSPTRSAIREAFAEQGFAANEKFDIYLDALEFMKLARSDTSDVLNNQRVFAFSHRRFQEYFPTKLVLAEDNISVEELLINPRWRETTVVICQTQSAEIVIPIINVAWKLLDSCWEKILPQMQLVIDSETKELPIEFPWPEGCLHLLDLLQDGFSNRLELLPDGLRNIAGTIVSLATLLGSLPHRVWALEVSGILGPSELLKVIRPAITNQSHFLSDIAFRQAAKLDEIPADIKAWIKRSILRNLLSRGIFEGNNAIYAQISRFATSREYIAVLRGIQLGHWIDIISSIVISAILVISAFTVPLANEFMVGVITYRVVMIIFAAFALMVPLTVYSEDQIPSFFLRFLYVGVVLSLFVPIMLLVKANSYYLIPVLYAPFVMSFVVDAVDAIPFEKSLIYVLFSPFFLLSKGIRIFLNGLRSLQPISLSKRSKQAVLIGLVIVLVICVGTLAPLWIWKSDVGIVVIAFISSLYFPYIIYQMFFKMFREEIKHAIAWRKWLRETERKVTVHEIVAVLPKISSPFAYKLVRIIRQENMLEITEESEYFVNQLTRLVENPALKNEFAQPLSLFLDDIGRNTIRSNKHKSMFLDELFLLIQKMKSMRQ